jgi:hypothetical protein
VEVGPYIENEEIVSRPDLLKVFADRVVTVFGITGTIDNLRIQCPVDLNASNISLDQKNAFVIKAANESGLEIEAEYSPYFSEVLGNFGLERKFTVAPAKPNEGSTEPIEMEHKQVDQAANQKTISIADTGNRIEPTQREFTRLVTEDHVIIERFTKLDNLVVTKTLEEQIKPNTPVRLPDILSNTSNLDSDIKTPKPENIKVFVVEPKQDQDNSSPKQKDSLLAEIDHREITELNVQQDRSEWEPSHIVHQTEVLPPYVGYENLDFMDLNNTTETASVYDSYEQEYFNHLLYNNDPSVYENEDLVLSANLELPSVINSDNIEAVSGDSLVEPDEDSIFYYDDFLEGLLELSNQFLPSEIDLSGDFAYEHSVNARNNETDNLKDAVLIVDDLAQELAELDFRKKQLVSPIIENILNIVMFAELLDSDSEDVIKLEESCAQLFETLDINYEDQTIKQFLQILKYGDFAHIIAAKRQSMKLDLQNAGTHEIKYPTNYLSSGIANSNMSFKQVIGTFVMACIKAASIQSINGVAS